MNKMNRKRVLQKCTKVALIIVVLLIVIGVCFFAYNRDTMREHCRLESIIVDQFDSEGIIIYTPNFQGYEIMYAYVTKDTKGYDEFIHRNGSSSTSLKKSSNKSKPFLLNISKYLLIDSLSGFMS